MKKSLFLFISTILCMPAQSNADVIAVGHVNTIRPIDASDPDILDDLGITVASAFVVSGSVGGTTVFDYDINLDTVVDLTLTYSASEAGNNDGVRSTADSGNEIVSVTFDYDPTVITSLDLLNFYTWNDFGGSRFEGAGGSITNNTTTDSITLGTSVALNGAADDGSWRRVKNGDAAGTAFGSTLAINDLDSITISIPEATDNSYRVGFYGLDVTVVAVPEPGSLLVLAIVGLGVGVRRRR